MGKVKSYKKNTNKKLTSDFNLNEFHCKGKGCCNTTLLDLDLVKTLQKIRNHFGKAIRINSGYRCPTHNASPSVGGDKNSSHCKGEAADIVVQGIEPLMVAKYCERIKVPRIGLYADRVHVGVGESKLYWKNKGKKNDYSINTFNGNTYPMPKSTIKKGSKGDEVKWVQYQLKEKGYRAKNGTFLKVDGDCGDNTVFAINQFRKHHGWKPSGILKTAGIKTLAKFGK